MGELHELTMLEQAAAIRRQEVTTVELVEHYLRRIEAFDGELGAFVTVTAEAALAQARAADQALAAEPDRVPALLGVPIGIKDLTLTSGVRTTFGSAAFADHVPATDADVVSALRAAGTISLGKTATSEFGCSLYCETALGPPTRNPWDLENTAGGSSGGAAAAVAAGLLPAAPGSDGGGSVRIPAAICGLVGFKPSRGVVSTGPVGFGGFGLPTGGPLARTVADAAALLDAMATPFPGEPHLPPPAPSGGYLAAAGQPVPGRLRVGRWTTPVLMGATVEPVCLAAVDAAAAALSEAGHEVVDVAPPIDPARAEQFVTVWQALALAAPVPPEREAQLLPLTRWLRAAGRETGTERLLAALAVMQAEVRAGARRLARLDLDLLLSPTLAAPQAPVGWFAAAGEPAADPAAEPVADTAAEPVAEPVADPAADLARQAGFSPFCAAYNLTGQPAVSLPLASTPAGAPVGVMLAAAPGADALLMQVAAELERAMPWADRHPPARRRAGSATVNNV